MTHGPRTHALAGARWRARCTPRARRDVPCLRRRCPAQKKLKIFPFFSCRPRARWRNTARVGTIEEQAPRRGYAAIARLDLAGASRASSSRRFVLDCAMGNARVVRAVMVRAVAAKCGPTSLRTNETERERRSGQAKRNRAWCARIDTGPERDGSRDRRSGFARRPSCSRSRARFASVVSPGKSHQSESFVETPQIAPSVAEPCAVTVARSGWSDRRISNVIRAMSR